MSAANAFICSAGPEYRAQPYWKDSKLVPQDGTVPTATGMEGKELKMYERLRSLNLRGCLAMLIYLAALGFYIWVRVTKTLDLAQYTCGLLLALPSDAQAVQGCMLLCVAGSCPEKHISRAWRLGNSYDCLSVRNLSIARSVVKMQLLVHQLGHADGSVQSALTTQDVCKDGQTLLLQWFCCLNVVLTVG